jgi:flagellin
MAVTSTEFQGRTSVNESSRRKIMAFQVNANVSAMQVYANLGTHQVKAANSLAMISSGLKAAGAGDASTQGSAATLMITNGATKADIVNVQNQINALQSADSIYGEAMAMVQQGLLVAAGTTLPGADTSAITAQLAGIIAGVALLGDAIYNGSAVLGAAFESVIMGTVTPDAIAAVATATAGFTAAAGLIADSRAKNSGELASAQKALQVLQNISANEMGAIGQAQDVDIATEMMNLTSANIMTEAATAMLAQAMQLPNTVLKLLQ